MIGGEKDSHKMLTPENDNMLEQTDSEPARRTQFVDIHCHCLGGLDDGPATMCESIALCRALVDDEITTVIATPHQLGRFSECNDAEDIRRAVDDTNEQLRANDIALRLLPGADIRIDERICQLLEADRILTLADGGKYILLELPHETLIDIAPLITDLASMGTEVILSHPERHPALAGKADILQEWMECSAHLQITAGSVLGDFGAAAEMFAWQLLEAGSVSLVATDCHDLVYRRPRMSAAFERMRYRLGERIARLICIENPRRIVEGQTLNQCTESWGTPVAAAQSKIL